MDNRSLLVAAAALLLTSCSGTVLLTPLDPADLADDARRAALFERLNPNQQNLADQGAPGVIVYLPKQVVEVDAFTQATTGSDGKTVISIPDCNAVYTRKVINVPDTQHPYLIHYKHGVLEGYTFGANLNPDGTLLSFNSVSAPDQGKTIQAVTAGAVSASTVVHALAFDKHKPSCTISPTFVNYEKVPPTGKYEFDHFKEPTPE